MQTPLLEQIFKSIGNKIERRDLFKEDKIENEKIKIEVDLVISNKSKLTELMPFLFEKYEQNPETIFKILSELETYLHFQNYAYELCSKVLLEVLNNSDISANEEIFKKLEDVNSVYFWNIIQCLPYVLSEYKLDSAFAVKWFFNIGEKIQHVMASGDFLKAIGNYSFSFPAEAKNVFISYKNKDFEAFELQIASVILGSIRASTKVNRVDNKSFLSIENELKESANENYRIVYYKSWLISYFRDLEYFDDLFAIIQVAYKGKKREIEEAFFLSYKVIINDSKDEIKITKILDWFNITVYSKLSPESKFYIVDSLYWLFNYCPPSLIDREIKKIEKIFTDLLPIEIQYAGTWNKIEQLLISQIRVRPQYLNNFIILIIENSLNEFLELLWNGSFQSLEYKLSGELLNSIYTRLLFSEKTYERQASFKIFSRMHGARIVDNTNLPTVAILSSILLEFSRNILLAENTSQFLLMLEPFYSETNSELKNEFVKEMVSQAVNYPGACLHKWEKIQEPSVLLKEVISKASKYFDRLKSIEHLPARNINYFEFVKGAELERKILSRDINKKINEKSVFLNLIKHTQILYGDSWSISYGIEGGKPQKFQEVSHAAEFPRLEYIDPEGMVLKRFYVSSELKK
ncbi:MAG: hypothetical protein ACYDEE_09540 [Ignavibacteriaceae bacterium]